MTPDEMQAEIDRLERILDALREPSEGVSAAIWLEWSWGTMPDVTVATAVAAAEQEVRE